MENENKNPDTQDNKPKFSFRPAETPIEDFPLAEEEDETPTSDGYGYSDFEADDGDDDYPEEKLSFRERLAKRRAETEASNAAEQAAFDEDDEYEKLLSCYSSSSSSTSLVLFLKLNMIFSVNDNWLR